MIQRYALSVLLGVVATFGLFFLMQSLIAIGSPGAEKRITGSVIDFVRVRDDSATQTKRRTMPRKMAQEKPPPPPDINMAKANKPKSGDMAGTTVNLDFELQGGPGIGGAPTDGDIIPLVRIEPRYPTRALSRGIEGWVLLEFTITAAGTVRDPIVVDSEPARIFDRAATRAVMKWKYKPKVEDGVPVERHGVQVVLSFELEKDGRL